MNWVMNRESHARPGDGASPDEIDDLRDVPEEDENARGQNMRALADAKRPCTTELAALQACVEQLQPLSSRQRIRALTWLHDWVSQGD